MPVYNAGQFLEQCMDSILAQTNANWQLIAVNDYSEDDSESILNKYASTDARIHILRNTAKGIIPALRLALKNSTGAYVTRMDADDTMHPDKLLLMKEKLDRWESGYLVTGLVKYISSGKLGEGYRNYEKWLNDLSLQENNFDDIYKECVIPSPCWMIHRPDLEKAGAFNPDIYPEDYDLCFRFRKSGLQVKSVKSVIHYWRDHPQRSSRTSDHYADNSFLKLKVKHFLDSDYQPGKRLILWGAGKKGKFLASLLGAKMIAFHWLSNNPNKIDHRIYDQIIEPSKTFQFQAGDQLIVAIADKKSQTMLTSKLEKLKETPGIRAFRFC